MKFGIHFGAMVDPLRDQIESQGIQIAHETLLDACQKDADCVSRLHIRGILTEAQMRSAEKKILKNIQKCV
jgi:hypothetical protein